MKANRALGVVKKADSGAPKLVAKKAMARSFA
jgi:hypothetical protein